MTKEPSDTREKKNPDIGSDDSNLKELSRPHSNSKRLTQITAIVGTVALLALVMYPGAIFPQKAASQNAVSNNTSDIAPKTYPPLTADQQAICGSVHDELVSVISSGANSNASQDAAVDMLEGIYCNRADLVDELGSTSYPATGLAAYACQAARGTIDDADASDAVIPYSSLYCGGATTSLAGEISDLKSAANALAGDPRFADAIQKINGDLNQAQSTLQDRPYAAYQALDLASSTLAHLSTL